MLPVTQHFGTTFNSSKVRNPRPNILSANQNASIQFSGSGTWLGIIGASLLAACLGFFSLGASSNKPNETSSLSRVVSGQAKNKPIFENRHAAVIMNADPASPGSALVVAKRPVQLFKDLSSEESASVFKLAQQYQEFWNHLPANKGKTIHYTLLVNDGPLAGQTDPQFHLHIIPATRANPIKPGTIKYAINPNAKGLPWTASGWEQRFQEIHAPINAEKTYLKQFLQRQGLQSQFDLTA